MDLCGPMRVQTINGKKYILVIVDDYSRFTWVKFLRSKDETPEVVIKFLKQIQVGLNKTVRNIRTDNGTEFVNKDLTDYYERVGIFHQKTVPRTPQQNGVVERRNRTLVEAARTMLIFSKAPMFLWAEAVATACYTQNRSLIHTRHCKTPYELVHDKKPDLTFFRVFGALCYPTNDSEDLGKLQPTADIGIFVGYAPSRKGYRIYNKRTRRIMETIHVQFDELTEQMAPVQLSTGPAPTFLTPGQISLGLVPNSVPAAPYVPPTNKELEILFQPMFDEYMEPPRVERPVSPAPTVSVPVNSAGTPSSTTIDQDAPSPSHSPSSSAFQSPSLHKGVAADSTLMEDNPFAPVDNHPFINELVPQPECVMIIALKWIYKVKLDEYGDVLKNKARGIFINQSKFALGILKKFGMDSCDPIDTPMVDRLKLDEDPLGILVDQTRFRSMVGSLRVSPTKKHLEALKRVFQYLKGTINLGLWYPKDTAMLVIKEIEEHCDLNYRGRIHCHVLDVCAQILWDEITGSHVYGFAFDNNSRIVTNRSAIALLLAIKSKHSRSKHIDIRHHFIREQVEKGMVELECLRKLLNIFRKEKRSKRWSFYILYTMADVNVNALAEQAPAMAPPTRTDDQILPRSRWVPVRKSNCYLDVEKSQSNPIYKIDVDILEHTNFFRAFTASLTIPSIYIQQFWDTIRYVKKTKSYSCQLDEQWLDLTKDTPRDALQITPGKKKSNPLVIPSVRFTKLIIRHLQSKHKFHSRPDSPLHLPYEEYVLGYLKFSAKGTKREVFRMPIPNDLIIDEIRGEQYYNEYLEKVAKHQRYLAGEEVSDPDSPAPKPAKATKPKATKQSKPQPPKPTLATTEPSKKDQSKKHKLVKESSEAPSPANDLKLELVYGDEEANTQRAIEESLKEVHDAHRGPLPPMVIREPDSGKFQLLLNVQGKGKEKVNDEQVALDLLTLQTSKKKSPAEQYIF
ncbi:retrovirus-related pol polyprotein from transposon TNT 1-94 [Tanacetum coccineum]